MFADGLISVMYGAWFGGDVFCRFWRYRYIVTMTNQNCLTGLHYHVVCISRCWLLLQRVNHNKNLTRKLPITHAQIDLHNVYTTINTLPIYNHVINSLHLWHHFVTNCFLSLYLMASKSHQSLLSEYKVSMCSFQHLHISFNESAREENTPQQHLKTNYTFYTYNTH